MERYAVYGLTVTEDDITQTERPVRVCRDLDDAMDAAFRYRERTGRPASVWLEERVNGRWECLESDVYVS